MAVWVLLRALQALDELPPHYRHEVMGELGLGPGELDRWRDITKNMRVAFTPDGLLAQFDGCDQLEEFDFAGYRARYGDIRRLDRVLEAEGDSTNRYQISKQADVLMLRYLLPSDELQDLLSGLGYHMTAEQLAQTARYYRARTVDGSALSGVVTSWVLARQNPAEAWRCLLAALNNDVADVQGGTTAEGMHLGAMAGTLDIVLRCLTGMLPRGDTLRFDPALPAEVKHLRFSVHYRGSRLDINLAPDRMSVVCRPGRAAPVTVMVREETRQLGPGDSAEFLLLGRAEHVAASVRARELAKAGESLAERELETGAFWFRMAALPDEGGAQGRYRDPRDQLRLEFGLSGRSVRVGCALRNVEPSQEGISDGLLQPSGGPRLNAAEHGQRALGAEEPRPGAWLVAGHVAG